MRTWVRASLVHLQAAGHADGQSFNYDVLCAAMMVSYLLLSALLIYIARPPQRPTREPAEAVSTGG